MTREERLNNPMGLKQSTDKFQGEVQPSRDPVFKQFMSEMEGIRAGAKTLLSYFNIHGLGTITGIITRWAPGLENNTSAYIDDVCARTGYLAGQILDLTSGAVLEKLTAAIIHHENGDDADPLIVKQAVLLAYA